VLKLTDVLVSVTVDVPGSPAHICDVLKQRGSGERRGQWRWWGRRGRALGGNVEGGGC